jgi:DNA-directed RNA polymerase specialized sigma24 family protein
MRVVQDAWVSTGRRGDLERLFQKDGVRIWRALVAYSGDREVASDALAEAFAQALARADEIHSPERWVWRAQPASVGKAYDMPEPPHDLIAALAKLSPKQRKALILRYYVGYPTHDVARILGSSTATVRVHLSQGRRRLSRLLEDHDG